MVYGPSHLRHVWGARDRPAVARNSIQAALSMLSQDRSGFVASNSSQAALAMLSQDFNGFGSPKEAGPDRSSFLEADW